MSDSEKAKEERGPEASHEDPGIRNISRLARRTFLKQAGLTTVVPPSLILLNSGRWNSLAAAEISERDRLQHSQEFFIDIEAQLHLDIGVEGAPTELVTGTIKRGASIPTAFTGSLRTASGRPFGLISALPCVVIIIALVLDFPEPADSVVGPPPVNFLDITGNEYSSTTRFAFIEDIEDEESVLSGHEKPFAEKKQTVRRIGRDRFKAEIEANLAFPHSLSEPVIQALPIDTTVIDAGPGRACGRAQVRWLTSEGAFLTADMLTEFRFKNTNARIPFPEVFSYEFAFSDIWKLPLAVTSTGVVRKVC